MNPKRAFVAHSFTADDAAVIDKFLKHFQRLHDFDPSFSFDHAEGAEPRELAEKVKRLISDKNLLIAICTKKERVVAPDDLRPCLIGSKLAARETAFAWKTSDWIIQEIGLAIGKGMDLILLVEDGVRRPGGLQGNIEYVTFERDAPEKSFDKILEMITALSPKAQAQGPMVSEPPHKESEVVVPAPSEADDLKTPTADWDVDTYERALYSRITGGDDNEASELTKAFEKSALGQTVEAKATWEAFGEFLRLLFNKGGSLGKLKQLGVDHPNISDIQTFLGRVYERFKQYDQAAMAFERAASVETRPKRLSHLRDAIVAWDRAGKKESTSRVLAELRGTACSDEQEREILKAEWSLAEQSKNDQLFIVALERLVELEPTDEDLRFKLAYKHSGLGLNELALLHYISLPKENRSTSAWNNLGVAYDRLGIPARAVDAFRRAEASGDTLAMSNIAKGLTTAGFLPEAKQICDAALAHKEFDSDVPKSLARLQDVPEQEHKQSDAALDKARPVSEFYQDAGHAMALPWPTEKSSAWTASECPVLVKVEGDTFLASGQYEVPKNSLLGYMMQGFASAAGVLRMEISYRGDLRGRLVVGTVNRRNIDAPPSPLLLSEPDPKVLMVLSDDGATISVLERTEKGEPRFYKLNRAT